ncbi:MAG: tetratricopeptide repeat protein [Pyrinomonadaceae bacterium]|nr:tetratricopeptide repeat protein [Pyrinomonadaceae bacterium]
MSLKSSVNQLSALLAAAIFVFSAATAAIGQGPVYRPSATPPVYTPKATPSPTPSSAPAMKPPVYTWAAAETLTSVSQVTDVKPTDFWYKDLQTLIEKYGIAGLTEGKKLMPNRNLTPSAYRTMRQSAIVQLRQVASRMGMLNSRFDELFPANCPDPKAVADVMTSGEVVNSLKCIFGPSKLKAIYPDEPMTRGYFVQVFDDAVENGMSKISTNSSQSSVPPASKPSPATIKQLIDRGQLLMSEKKYDEAIRTFNQVIDYDPNNIEAYRMRGVSALLIYEQNPPMQGSKLYTAQFNFDLAIGRGSTNPDDFYMRGMTFERQGEKDKAIRDYRSALKLNPNHQGAKDALKKLGVNQ